MPSQDLATRVGQRADAVRNGSGEQGDTVWALLERQKPEIARALPAAIDPERFARIALTVLRQTPQLLQCDPLSVLGALMLCAQLGLEPGPLGHAYLVPFKREATFILGYKGMLTLARRSGEIESIVAREVRDGDHFTFNLATNDAEHRYNLREDRGGAYAYYGLVTYRGGGRLLHVMGRSDINRHRERSRAKDSGPWVTDFDAMARKTVIRAMSPWLPLTVEAARAVMHDETVQRGISPNMLDSAPVHVDMDTGEVTPAEARQLLGEQPAPEPPDE